MNTGETADRPSYRQRKAAFGRCLTVYGRKPVLEALGTPGIQCERLHLARSNRESALLEQIVALARDQRAEILWHERASLSRISRNQREDQGVAADVRWSGYADIEEKPPVAAAGASLLALDGINNPQNLGMLIRSAAAADVPVLLPRRGNCGIGPLVIKASAGALFRASLLRCEDLAAALQQLRRAGWRVCVLDATARENLFELQDRQARVFVLGGESEGVSGELREMADQALAIPMANRVESLNVAVSAALVAFRAALRR